MLSCAVAEPGSYPRHRRTHARLQARAKALQSPMLQALRLLEQLHAQQSQDLDAFAVFDVPQVHQVGLGVVVVQRAQVKTRHLGFQHRAARTGDGGLLGLRFHVRSLQRDG